MLEQGYWIMPNSILFDKNLSDKQKLLFCYISSLCAEKWYCRASNNHIWEKLWVSWTTISTNISKLSELLYIEIDLKDWHIREIKLKGGFEKSKGGVLKNQKHNNTSIINKKNNKKKELEFEIKTQKELLDKWENILKPNLSKIEKNETIKSLYNSENELEEIKTKLDYVRVMFYLIDIWLKVYKTKNWIDETIDWIKDQAKMYNVTTQWQINKWLLVQYANQMYEWDKTRWFQCKNIKNTFINFIKKNDNR